VRRAPPADRVHRNWATRAAAWQRDRGREARWSLANQLYERSAPTGRSSTSTDEHRQTEVLIDASGLSFTLLHNGWYTENYAASISALQHGAFIGSASDGRIPG
jgi:hypothetical protein